MKNKHVFVRILTRERIDRLLSEIALESDLIALQMDEIGYYVLDDIIYCSDDYWGMMSAHLV